MHKTGSQRPKRYIFGDQFYSKNARKILCIPPFYMLENVWYHNFTWSGQNSQEIVNFVSIYFGPCPYLVANIYWKWKTKWDAQAKQPWYFCNRYSHANQKSTERWSLNPHMHKMEPQRPKRYIFGDQLYSKNARKVLCIPPFLC